jgi:DNA repair exonuclease SbcCD ATPase subunit
VDSLPETIVGQEPTPGEPGTPEQVQPTSDTTESPSAASAETVPAPVSDATVPSAQPTETEKPEHTVPLETFIRERIALEQKLKEARREVEEARQEAGRYRPVVEALREEWPEIQRAREAAATLQPRVQELEAQAAYFRKVAAENNLTFDESGFRRDWEQQQLSQLLKTVPQIAAQAAREAIHSIRSEDQRQFQAQLDAERRATAETAARAKAEAEVDAIIKANPRSVLLRDALVSYSMGGGSLPVSQFHDILVNADTKRAAEREADLKVKAELAKTMPKGVGGSPARSAPEGVKTVKGMSSDQLLAFMRSGGTVVTTSK